MLCSDTYFVLSVIPPSEVRKHSCLNLDPFAAKLWKSKGKVADIRGASTLKTGPWYLHQNKTKRILGEVLRSRCYEVSLRQLEDLKHLHKIEDSAAFVREMGYKRIFLYEAIEFRLFPETQPRITKGGGVTWSYFRFVDPGKNTLTTL